MSVSRRWTQHSATDEDTSVWPGAACVQRRAASCTVDEEVAVPFAGLTGGDTDADAKRLGALLDEALRLDPDYAHAHALMAYVHGQVFRSAIGPAREEARMRAVGHAREATGSARVTALRWHSLGSCC
jgi:hypothetical protein